MNNKIIVGLVVVAILLGGFGAIKQSKNITQVREVVKEVVGSSTGPDSPSPYQKYGGGYGVRTWKYGYALTQATTTPCAFLSPAATSTLLSAGLKLDVASTSATVWTFAQATSAYATTTAIGTDYAVAASAKAFVQASTSPAALARTVFAPNTYLVIGVRGGDSNGDTSPDGLIPSGSCNATFEEYPSL